MPEYIERGAVSTMLHRLQCEFANAGNSDGARACILADINLSAIPAADAIEELAEKLTVAEFYMRNQPAEPRWISAKDRLPEKVGTYLIVTNKGKVMSDSYAPISRGFNGNAGRSCTHWMPLPEPPKED